MAVKKNVTTKKRNVNKRRVENGAAHIHASFNNTIVTITDLQGNAISWSSSGKLKLRGSKKSTAFAAQLVSEDAAKVAYDSGLRTVEVYVKGPHQRRVPHPPQRMPSAQAQKALIGR